MTMECFSRHKDYLKEWPEGIFICLLCAAKDELAQQARTALLKIKMMEAL